MPTDNRAVRGPQEEDETKKKKKKKKAMSKAKRRPRPRRPPQAQMIKLRIEDCEKEEATRSEAERWERPPMEESKEKKKEKDGAVLIAQPDNSMPMSDDDNTNQDDRPPPKVAKRPPPCSSSYQPPIVMGRQNRQMTPGYEIPDDVKAALQRYRKQKEQSGGYDVDFVPINSLPFGMCYLLRPVPQGFFHFYRGSALLAIEKANKRKKSGKLTLLRIIKVNVQYSLLYMTLEAYDSADEKIKVYQAKIESEERVLEFRLKPETPQEEGKGEPRSTRCTRGKWLQERYHEQYV